MQKILEEILSKFRPTEDEIREVHIAICRFIEDLEEALMKTYGHRHQFLRVTPAGSAVRGTFTRYERYKYDIDLFVVHPYSWELSEFFDKFKKACEIFYKKYGANYTTEYAQHPYYKGMVVLKDHKFKSYEVEIVPCYEMIPGKKVKSPVDRSIRHNWYLLKKYKENPQLRDTAILLKTFFQRVGVYGAEARVGGFSGYLIELLAVYYGSFFNALNEISRWRPYKIFLWIEEPGTWREGMAPMVFVDPVSPERNAAAAVTEEAIEIISEAARDFFEIVIGKEGEIKRNALYNFFIPIYESKINLTEESIQESIENLRRSSEIFVIKFSEELTALHPDVVYTELKRSAEGLKAKLKEKGVEVKKYYIDYETPAILFVIGKTIRRFKMRPGPPSDAPGAYEKRFLMKNFLRKNVALIAFTKDRWRVVELVEERRLDEILNSILTKASHGKDIRKHIESGNYEIILGEDVFEYINRLSPDQKLRTYMFLSGIKPWKAIHE